MNFDRLDITVPRHSGHDRSIVPMINVVFLLLIFFLMTASLAPPPPLDITAPVAETPLTERTPGTLYIDASGTLAFDGLRGDAALMALARAAPSQLPVLADAALPAADLASLLPQLGAIGVSDIELRTVTP